MRQRGLLHEVAAEQRQDAQLHEHLKPVADADHQLARSHKLA